MSDEVKVAVKRPTMMIATPMYGGMCTGGYTAGLLSTMSRMHELGIPTAWAQIPNESLITRARNALVRIFLEHGHDYLMFIDADISFDGDAVAQLLAADEDIVCGIYPKKEIDWKAVERAALAGRENLRDFGGAYVLNFIGADSGDTDERGVFEVRHGGTGFMLIKRGVFERLAPHVPTYRTSSVLDPETGEYLMPEVKEFFATSIDETGALLSEDYHFCELFRKHGGRVFANPFVKLDHIGTYTYTGNLLRAGVNLK